MSVLVTNNGTGYLMVGIDAVTTKILLKPDQGARFPAPVPDQDWFYITVEDSEGNREVMKCTSRTSDTFTVLRGQDGTTARPFVADSLVELRPCAGLFNDKVNRDEYERWQREIDTLMEEFRAEITTKLNAQKAELTTKIEKVEDDLNTKIDDADAASKTDLEDFKTEVSETYLPLAGGTMTGKLTAVDVDVTGTTNLQGSTTLTTATATGEIKAKTFAIKG